MMEIIVEKAVIEKLRTYTSRHPSTETGGFLYGRINPAWIYIGDLSEAGPNADKTAYGVRFDREYIIEYTLVNLEKSLFVVGTWHTHPSNTICHPSSIDINTMHSFRKVSSGRLSVFCISMIERENIKMQFFSLSSCSNPVLINSVKLTGFEEKSSVR